MHTPTMDVSALRATSTSVAGCDFGDVWTTRIPGKIGDLPVNFISKEQYIGNKRGVGRPQDLADLEALT